MIGRFMHLKCLFGFHAYQDGAYGLRYCKHCNKVAWDRKSLSLEINETRFCHRKTDDEKTKIVEMEYDWFEELVELSHDFDRGLNSEFNKQIAQDSGYIFMGPVDDSVLARCRPL